MRPGDAQETPRACNAIFITRPRTCLGKNDKFMFPRPARTPTPRYIPVVIFIRGRETRKLDRNVFTTRLFIKPSNDGETDTLYLHKLACLLTYLSR